jgi:DNA-binding beta-propeller fold protein YncE
MRVFFCLILLAIFNCSCDTDESYVVSGCEDKAGVHVICGIQSPEDMMAIPNSPFILISEYGNMGGSTGKITLLDRNTEKITKLFPLENNSISDKKPWGAPNCKGEPSALFSPHGIDLVQRENGDWQLLVVNHQQSDRIDIFEIVMMKNQVQLNWNGCVNFPSFAMLNDVAGLKDGSFLTTHMFDKLASTIGGINVSLFMGAFLGLNSGHVWSWSRTNGLEIVPGSEGALPNGIAISQDQKSFFMNVYGAGEVRRINQQSGAVEASTRVSGPDNIAWGEDGFLYIASHQPPFKADTSECIGTEHTACGYPFKVVKLDALTMNDEVVFEHSGAPFGAATVAVQVDDALYMGSFAGNRVAKVIVR